jgi:diguanylate cyclase (GGDEF)-like protein
VASDVAALDTEKFYILAQQFLVGVKRAILYKKIQELAITDSLTQVFSRRYFLERFAEELERSKKFRFKFSFLMLDIDRFKDYNDRLGHLVGDAILKEIARLVKENIRQVDFMGRYGGEELCAVLTETGREEALAAAERIRLAVASGKIRAYDEELQATISIGVATFPDDSLDAKEIIERADKALYRAKEAGRNMVCQAEKIS